jgi:hypothetical protein
MPGQGDGNSLRDELEEPGPFAAVAQRERLGLEAVAAQ